MEQNMRRTPSSGFTGKKYIVSAIVIIAFAFYVWYQKHDSDAVNVIAPASLQNSNIEPQAPAPQTTATSATPSSGSTPPPATAPKATGQYRDGTYTGQDTDAYYGNLKIQVVISGGKISDVVFLDYPKDRKTSEQINSQAMPYLKAEAIRAQSASVDIISGATQTSQAFIQSLSQILTSAKS